MKLPLEALRRRGFDLAWPFSRRALPPELALPEAPGDLGLLLGNTRALWPAFLGSLTPAQRAAPDPLDTWVEEALTALLPGAVLLWAHRPDAQGRHLPLQRLAQHSGLAALSPAHLCAHPEYGPWIALRAVALLEAPAPPPSPPAQAPCQGCAAPCAQALARALEETGEPTQRSVRENWKRWWEIRRVCPVGRAHSYSLEQAAYHYTADPLWLAPEPG